MTTQVRPLTGGAWNNVTLDTNKCARKTTTLGVTLNPGLTATALRAMNEWINNAGTGTAATRAQATAAAAGIQLQEI